MGDIRMKIEGEENVNEEYVEKMRKQKVKIVPRLYLDLNDVEQFIESMESGNKDYFFKRIKKVFGEYGGRVMSWVRFDGMVFDSPIVSYLNRIGYDFLRLFEQMRQSLRRTKPDFVWMTTLMGYDKEFGWRQEQIQRLVEISDKVLVCTYDYPKQV